MAGYSEVAPRQNTNELNTTIFKRKYFYLKDSLTVTALELLKCLVKTPRSFLFCLEHEKQFTSVEAFLAAMLDLVRPGDEGF